jgi:hypothetical protein
VPFDIAVRRLVVTRYELQRAWQGGLAWVAARRPQPAPPAQRVERLSSLFAAKNRANADTRVPPSSTPSPIVTPTAPSQRGGPHAANSTDNGEAQPVGTTMPAGGAADELTASMTSAPTATSAVLLAKKRARDKKPSG